MSHVRQGVQEEAERRHPPDGRARSHQGGPRHPWQIISGIINSITLVSESSQQRTKFKSNEINLRMMYKYCKFKERQQV